MTYADSPDDPTHYVVSAAAFRTMLAATAGEHLYHGRALEVEFREAAIPVERAQVTVRGPFVAAYTDSGEYRQTDFPDMFLTVSEYRRKHEASSTAS
jgi:hypothetical protein